MLFIYFLAKTTRYIKHFLIAFEYIYDTAVVDKMTTEWLKIKSTSRWKYALALSISLPQSISLSLSRIPKQ